MKSISVNTALGLLLSLTFSAPNLRAQIAAKQEMESTAIKQFVAGFADTWNKHDAHGVAMHYVEDGDFSSIRGEGSHGRKELEDHYNMIFSTFLKNAHTTDTVRSIRFLTPDLASVDIDWLVNEPSAPGGVLRKGLLTWVVTKRNGEWKVLIYHEQSY